MFWGFTLTLALSLGERGYACALTLAQGLHCLGRGGSVKMRPGYEIRTRWRGPRTREGHRWTT